MPRLTGYRRTAARVKKQVYLTVVKPNVWFGAEARWRLFKY